MTLRELIERAIEMAGGGTEQMAEAAVGVVFANVSGKLAARSSTRPMLTRTHSLVFTAGLTVLPATVITPYLCESSLSDPADITKLYSLAPWDQFINGLDMRLGHYSLEGVSDLHVVEPATAYDPASGPDITLNLNTPSDVEVPLLITDSVIARDEVVDELVIALTAALKMTNA